LIEHFELSKDVMGTDGPQGTVASFYKNSPTGWGTYVMVDKKSANGWKPLRDAIAALPSMPIQYKKLKPDEIAGLLARILGLDANDFASDIKKVEAEIEAKYKEMLEAELAKRDEEYKKAEEEKDVKRQKELKDMKDSMQEKIEANEAEQKRLQKEFDEKQKKQEEESKRIQEEADAKMVQFKKDHEESMAKLASKSDEEKEAARQEFERVKTNLLREVQQQREQAEAQQNAIARRQQRLEVHRRNIESELFDDDDDGCRGYVAVRRSRLGATVSTGQACKNCSRGVGCRWAGQGRPGHN